MGEDCLIPLLILAKIAFWIWVFNRPVSDKDMVKHLETVAWQQSMMAKQEEYNRRKANG